MKYRHIIWDWNGTLLNDVPLCLEITNELIAPHGRPSLSLERFRAILTHPMIDFYRIIMGEVDDLQYASFAEVFHQEYKLRRHHCSLQPDSLPLIEEIRALKVRQSILSAHPQTLLHEITRHFRLYDLFDEIIGARDNLAGSKIDAGKTLMSAFSHLSADTVLIGDTDHDAAVADTLGIHCILVAHGFQSRERLAQSKYPVASSLREVKEMLFSTAPVQESHQAPRAAESG